MQTKILLATLVAKINNRTGFKKNLSRRLSLCCTKKKKVEYWSIHVEIVKEQ